MSSHIPTEIVIDILARLPVKTLIRFTPVCKLWYSIITNPNFITTHSNRTSKRNADQLLLRFWCHDHKVRYLLAPDDDEIDENHIKIAFPLGTPGGILSIVGSCNGLVCLTRNYKKCVESVIIWNPSTRKSVTLALPEKTRKGDVSEFLFGSISGKIDYKLVRITYRECEFDRRDLVPVDAEVYEQGGERYWRAIRCTLPHFCDKFISLQVFLNGAVHWLTYGTKFISGFQNTIAVFEMTYEMFTEIALPPKLVEKQPTCLFVKLFKGSLAVLNEGGHGKGEYSLWVMKEYGVFESWNNLYNVVIPVITHLGFRKNGEILLKTNMGGTVSYNFETKTTRNFYIPSGSNSLRVHNFTESLVLLEREKAVSGLFTNLF